MVRLVVSCILIFFFFATCQQPNIDQKMFSNPEIVKKKDWCNEWLSLAKLEYAIPNEKGDTI